MTLMKPVTLNAFLKRLNRALAHEGLKLCKTRTGSRDEQNLGQYYLMEVRDRVLVCDDICLGDIGQSYNILADDERLDYE